MPLFWDRRERLSFFFVLLVCCHGLWESAILTWLVLRLTCGQHEQERTDEKNDPHPSSHPTAPTFPPRCSLPPSTPHPSTPAHIPSLLCPGITQPSEINFFLRSKMQSRMEEMRTAEAYVRERRTRWDNDTRGLLKEADRLVRKRRPAPPGYLDRMETSRTDQPWKTREGDHGDGKGGGGGRKTGGGGQQS